MCREWQRRQLNRRDMRLEVELGHLRRHNRAVRIRVRLMLVRRGRQRLVRMRFLRTRRLEVYTSHHRLRIVKWVEVRQRGHHQGLVVRGVLRLAVSKVEGRREIAYLQVMM